MALRLRPLSLREANAFVDEVHRHHGPTRGHKFSVGVEQLIGQDRELVGVAIAGRPVARNLDDGWHLEVLRLATVGTKNVCSMLYSACARAGMGMGYPRENILTYILESESGASLLAAGWVKVAETGGGSWSRPSRRRVDSHPLEAKTRWHAALPGDD